LNEDVQPPAIIAERQRAGEEIFLYTDKRNNFVDNLSDALIESKY
jgi:hypothetical protein